MAKIEISQELTDYLAQHESETGETPEHLIWKLIQSTKTGAKRERGRSSNSALSRFLAVLSEIEKCYTGDFYKVETVRGNSRIYFSKHPEQIEASGSGNKPVRIPESEWWVTSNTSTDTKARLLSDVLRTLQCRHEECERWMQQFFGPARVSVILPVAQVHDPFKI